MIISLVYKIFVRLTGIDYKKTNRFNHSIYKSH